MKSRVGAVCKPSAMDFPERTQTGYSVKGLKKKLDNIVKNR